MIKIFKPIVLSLGLMLSGFYVNAQTNQEEFSSKWNTMKGYTVEILEAMPDDKLDFKPVDDVMSFREMVMHIAGANIMMANNFLREGEAGVDLEKEDMSKAELKEAVEKSFDFVAETVASLTDAELAEEVEVFGGNKITRRQVENLIDTHGIHHRGNLIVYLRLNGIEPPAFRAW
ncbi:DinB family protein [Echinicola rosea]|nr:DinB family protein [Echinicola rosea]